MEKIVPKHYFMVGIGGISMQAIADVLLATGHKVTGSDSQDFPERKRLEGRGAKIVIGEHKATNVPDDIDELIYTSAIPRDYPDNNHPELLRARELGVPTTKRSKFIGKLMADKIGITVSGAHGKSTTTGLIVEMLQTGGLSPTALVGAEIKSLKGCGVVGSGDYMVVEACEYDRSFLDMKPKIAVLLNIDEDHLDYYQDLAEIKEAFAQFIESVPSDGLVVAWGDDPNVKEILPRAKASVVTFGFEEGNDLVAYDVNYTNGHMEFKADGISTYLNFPGRHLVLDALAAMVVARHLGVNDEAIKQTLEEKFKSPTRRFEILGDKKGVTFMDDYGHHPVEIKAMLQSAHDYFKDRKIYVVFQPHQFSRTRLLLADLAKSFKFADELLVAPILPVRDSALEQAKINSQVLVDEINKISHNARSVESFGEASQYLADVLKTGDVVLSLGAGKNSEWVREFMKQF